MPHVGSTLRNSSLTNSLSVVLLRTTLNSVTMMSVALYPQSYSACDEVEQHMVNTGQRIP